MDPGSFRALAMFVAFGHRSYGRVHEAGETFEITDFVHLNFLPLVPLRSRVVDRAGRSLPIPLSKVSVAAAYLRTWGVALAALLVILAMTRHAWPLVVLAVASAAVAALAWLRLGKLSPEALAQRNVYAEFTGDPVDVALLGDEVERVRASLFDDVTSRAPALMSATYRSAPDPRADWAEIARDPAVDDDAFLRAALTLARIERGRADRDVAARARWDAAHDAIWKRIATRASSNG